MTLDTNVSPYFDDYDESKLFSRILFKPSLAVQARELTQLQTQLQQQISRLGGFVFKNGSPVLGGGVSLNVNLDFVKVEPNFDGTAITVADYNGKILTGAESGARAKVLNVLGVDPTTNDPNTLFLSYLTGDSITDTVTAINVTAPGSGYTSLPTVTITGGGGSGAGATAVINVTSGEVIGVVMATNGTAYTSAPTIGFTGGGGTGATATATINTSAVFTPEEQIDSDAATNRHADVKPVGDVPTGIGSSVSIQSGIFYINTFFSLIVSQELILERYSNTPNFRVGVDDTQSVITASDDATLNDLASGSTNFNAPGADRLKIDLVLQKKDFSSVDDENFFEVMRIEDGVIKKEVKYQILSDIEKTFARRTFDESGNYTVRDFPLSTRVHDSDSAKFISQLDPGKAFIKGFEYETISNTDIEMNKARNFREVNGLDISAVYGNYIVVDTMSGPFDVDSMEETDLHDQPIGNEISSVLGDGIGTISTGDFTSAGSDFVSDGVAAGHRLYITAGADNAGGDAGTGIYTVVTVTDLNTLVVTPDFATGGGTQTFTIEGGMINDDSPNYETSKIGVANVRQVKFQSGTGAGPFVYRLYIFNIALSSGKLFKNLESVFVGPWNNTNPGIADIETLIGKAGAVATGDALLKETDFNSLVFKVAQTNIRTLKDDLSASDTSYQYQKVFATTSFTAGAATINVAGAQTFQGPLDVDSDADTKKAHYHLVITAVGTSSFALGEVVEFTTASRTITVNSPGTSVSFDAQTATNFTADIIASVNINTVAEKVKTLVKNNAITINTPNTAALSFDSLAISDVNALKAVYDNTTVPPRLTINTTVGGPFTVGETVTQSVSLATGEVIVDGGATLDIIVKSGTWDGTNGITGGTSGATANVTLFVDQTDISSRYLIDSGQRDNLYDHGRIQLNSTTAPTGTDIVAVVDYFTHTGVGYFSVDSYSNILYENIPNYTSSSTGSVINLRDTVDFRPRRQDGGTVFEGTQIPKPGVNVMADYSFYLSRIDKIFIDAKGNFGVIEGIPDLQPVDPPDRDETITLYIFRIPAFTFSLRDIIITQVKNKRFTMKDIGKLASRIDRIEYYTALNLLEQDTNNLSIKDTAGLDRFKNGILIDPFTGHAIGDVLNPDYRCSIDFRRKELRPPFTTVDVDLTYNSGASTGVTKTGDLITLPFTTELFVDQSVASSSVNVNPFNVTSWIGNVTVDPPNDTWVDTVTKPEILVNLEGEKDAWEFLGDRTIQTQWEDWKTMWSGTEIINSETSVSTKNFFNNDGRHPSTGIPENWWKTMETRVTRNTFETTDRQLRTGIQNQVVPETITRELGDRITDVSIIPFIRARTLAIEANSLKPNTRVYPFFDNVDVSTFCTPSGGSAGDPIYTDVAGKVVALSFDVPNSDTLRFKVGERIFRLIDNSSNVQTSSSTLGESKFFAQGLLQTKENTIVSTRVPSIQRLSVTENRSVTNVFNRTESQERELRRWYDPVAESFLVDAQIFPNGIFVESIDIFFKSKDAALPVTVQIREMINGVPSQKVVPFSCVSLEPAAVNISSDATAVTTFTFPSPVYLVGGEYSFVVMTNSNAYEVYISEMGQKIINTNRIISKQPYAGAFFKSQNASTWSADQNIDLAFRINKCVFTTAGTHDALFDNVGVSPTKNMDVMFWQNTNLVFNDTSLTYSKKTTNEATSILDTNFSTVFPNSNFIFDAQQKITNTAGTFVGKMALASINSDISPVIDTKFNNVMAIENIVNNLSTDETNSSGGDALARYITRRVTLADGFDSTDLKVVLVANKQSVANIQVYFKVLSAQDPDEFDDKDYVLMQQSSNVSFSSDTNIDFQEFEYIPVTSPITYGTYDSFLTFAIKIVMLSGNTSVIPRIKDLRVVSLL